MVYIGIDNGITGTIGIIDKDGKPYYYHMPIFKTVNYQKNGDRYVHRISVGALSSILEPFVLEPTNDIRGKKKIATVVAIERPMVNPTRFVATTSALRALEAVLITLENLGIYDYTYIDSKEWQRKLLSYIDCPKEEYSRKIKELSLQRAKQIFPELDLRGFNDGDGILIAWYNLLKYKGE